MSGLHHWSLRSWSWLLLVSCTCLFDLCVAWRTKKQLHGQYLPRLGCHTVHSGSGDSHPSPLLDNIQVMLIVWRLRENIIRTALCWIVWHNVYSQQQTYMSSSYRSNRLDLSHWDAYAVHRGSCLELYYCNMVKWFWWDSSLILTTNWLSSALWHCWFGHPACKNPTRNDLLCVEWDVKPYTLTHPQWW